MCLKYSSGAESFVQAVSFTIYNDAEEWTNNSPVDPYYRKNTVLFHLFTLSFSRNYYIWSSILILFLWKY